MSIFSKALRIGEGKRLKELEALVGRVNALEPETEVLSDADLAAKTVGSVQPLVHRTFRNLMRLALSDGEFDAKENKFMVSWGERAGLTPETMQELVDAAHASQEAGLEVSDREDVEVLISLALSDGHLSSRELKRIIEFGRRVGMDRSEVRAEITRIQRGTLRDLVPAAV